MNLEEILQQLMQSNFRYEILINSIIDCLEKKTMQDGHPVLTKEEISVRAEEIKKEIIEKARIARPQPGLIIPGSTPQTNAPKEG
jgi:hypothetical protein